MLSVHPSIRAEIAKKVNLGDQYLYQCFSGRRKLPAEHAPAIERATGGEITADALRPDVCWVRVPDPSWPHPDGRPCIDVAASADEGAAHTSKRDDVGADHVAHTAA